MIEKVLGQEFNCFVLRIEEEKKWDDFKKVCFLLSQIVNKQNNVETQIQKDRDEDTSSVNFEKLT